MKLPLGIVDCYLYLFVCLFIRLFYSYYHYHAFGEIKKYHVSLRLGFQLLEAAITAEVNTAL